MQVRNKWIGDFHKKDVGGYVRAWIYHRRLHSNTDPTDSEVSCILENEHDKKVTRDEIAMTFTRGDFVSPTITLLPLNINYKFPDLDGVYFEVCRLRQ